MRGGLFSFQRLSVQLSLHQHGVTLLHCTGLLQMVASIRFSHQLMRHDDYFIFGITIVKTSPACVDGTISIFEQKKTERDSSRWSIQLITCDLAQSAVSHGDSQGFIVPIAQLLYNWLCQTSWAHNFHISNIPDLLFLDLCFWTQEAFKIGGTSPVART